MNRASQVKKYFGTFPKGAVWGIIIGGIMTLFIANNVIVGLIGLAIAALSIWAIVSYLQKPSDQQIDAWIKEDMQKLQEQAKHKCDIGETMREPEIVTGLRFGDLPSGTFYGFQTGKDRILRWTPLDVTIINFTQDHLVVYQCALDLTTGNPLNESTDEYYYRDVVSVSTVTENRNVTVGSESVQMKAAETFKLTTSGGTSVQVTIGDLDFIKLKGGANARIDKSKVEKAITSIRAMLRQKKGGAVSA